MSNQLLLMNPDDTAFSPAVIRKIFESIDGVHDIREGQFIGSVMDCEFEFDCDSSIVRLSDDLKTISLSSVRVASLKMALELQRQLGRGLRAMDLGYNFDIDLAEIESVRAFEGIVNG